MIIGIDGRAVQTQKKAGISIYAHEITNNLTCESCLFLSSPLMESELLKNPQVKTKSLRFPTYRWKFEQIWEKTALPYIVNKSSAELFWGPRFFVPPGLNIPSVATIHDLAFILIDNIVTPKQISYFDNMIQSSLVNAKHFIAVSETTKKDFCHFYHVNEDRVTVIYNGFNQDFRIPVDEQKSREYLNKAGIKGNFVFFLGTLEPRKNLERLIDAYILSNAKKEGIPLVLAGKAGWLQDRLFEKIKPLVEEKLIILTGYVSHEELKILYQNCLFFAFPSIYEGFGIPVLEAMASGAPVLTSYGSSLEELFDKSALLTDPMSVNSILEGLNNIMKPTTRESYIAKGTEMVSKFSWQRSAKEHYEVFRKLI
jgi:glycosyltransferase involved in cell wall biosynthesis